MKGISVVLPVYNGADMIEDCLQSVSRAGSRVQEIIIVDDGSTDGTLEIANKQAEKDPRIRVIHTENHGTYMARVTGFRASTADYVTSIDADDRYYAGCLDTLVGLLEEQNADVVMGGLVETDSYETLFAPTAYSNTITVSTSEKMWPRIMKWKTQEFVCYINKLYKKELLKDLIDGDGICQGEDVLITCQAFLGVKKVVETTAPMYLYYQNPESLTRAGFSDRDKDIIRVWDYVVNIMKERRTDLLPMAQFNRWRTDFTLLTRLILVNDKELDKKYAEDTQKWRASIKNHWKDLISPHAMPRNREILLTGLRFFYLPTKVLMRIGRRLSKEDTGVILHSGEKR